ncbi:BTAD domain-containing putative transcriptional regulator [Paracidovorax citrulli]
MADIRLDLLGGFALRSPSGDAITLSARKARAVLAYLALAAGRPQPRDKLAALLWADSNAEQARSSLRQALTAIRRAVGSDVLAIAEGDRVLMCGVTADVVLFETYLQGAEAAALQAAADLYRGDLLDGFDAGSPAFDQWLTIERERLRALAGGLLERLVETYRAAGDLEHAVACAVRLLAMDPLREPVHRALMRLYQRQGRQASALKQYRICRALLQRELGISPEAETDALYQLLMRSRRAGEPADAAALGDEDDDLPEPATPVAAPSPPTAQPDAPLSAGGETAPLDTRGEGAARSPAAAVPAPSDAPSAAPSAVPAPAPSGPQLRHAVVVVAEVDLTGASVDSPGAAMLDPEQMHDVLVRWRAHAHALAASCGGHITDELGARLTVVFGVPVAHGNDAERAVHVATALHEGLEAVCPQCATPARARVGVASGQVLSAPPTAGVPGSMTLTGAPVAVAARVMEHAQPGHTVVSNRVYLALPGRIDASHLTDLVMLGIPESIPLWAVHRFLDPAETAPQHAFVGRSAELVQLAGVAGDCLRARQGRVVVIRGEAGIGKSRLAERFVALAREHGMDALRTLVLDFGVDRAGDPLRMLLANLFGASANAGTDALQRAVAQAVAAGRLAEEDEPFARDLLDIPCTPAQAAALAAMEPAVRQQGAQRCLVSLAVQRSERKALLIVVEDVHWAERALLACLARLAGATRSCPLVLALTVRPEQDLLDSGWRAATGNASLTTIDLGPLNEHEAQELATRYRHVGPLLAHSCIRRAEGNPLFLDQLLRNAETGSDADALPGSLQSIVLARLDRLPEEHRLALQAAAVLGQRFSPAALRYLLGRPDDPCDALVRQAMVRPEGEDYLFMHALIHEAVYASLLKSRRLALHRRAADWYLARDPALHAEHLEAAGEAGAARAYEAAARHEASHFRNERALRLVERALQLVERAPDDQVRQSLACLRGELMLDLGQPADALAAFRQAVTAAADDAQQARAWFGVAASLRLLDRYQEALAALEEAHRAALSTGEDEMLAQIESLRGNVHFPMGNMEACLAAHQKALHHAESAHSALGEVRALGGLGDASYQQGRMVTAREQFGRCVALAREQGFVRIEGANLPMVAVSDLMCHALPQSYENCEAALRIAHRIGDTRIEVLALDVMASTAQLGGDFPAVLRYTEQGLSVARRLGARRFEAELLGRRALALARVNADGDEAAEPGPEVDNMMAEAMELSHATGLRYSGPMILGFLARITPDPARQRAAIEEGERILAQGCVSHCHLDLYEAAIEVALQAEDWDGAERAAMALRDYMAAEPFPWASFHVRRAQLLAMLGRDLKAGRAAGQPRIAQLQALRSEGAQAGLGDALVRIDAALRRLGVAG